MSLSDVAQSIRTGLFNLYAGEPQNLPNIWNRDILKSLSFVAFAGYYDATLSPPWQVLPGVKFDVGVQALDGLHLVHPVATAAYALPANGSGSITPITRVPGVYRGSPVPVYNPQGQPTQSTMARIYTWYVQVDPYSARFPPGVPNPYPTGGISISGSEGLGLLQWSQGVWIGWATDKTGHWWWVDQDGVALAPPTILAYPIPDPIRASQRPKAFSSLPGGFKLP